MTTANATTANVYCGEYDIAILYTAGKAGARIYFVYYYQKPKSLVVWVDECDYGECDYGECDIAILYTAGKAGARIYFVCYYQKPKSLIVWVGECDYGECDCGLWTM